MLAEQSAIANFRRDKLFLLLVVTAGLALRLDFLLAGNFIIDADEAIVGLMAKHILERASLPVFYYGQHYMGSLEPILTAVLFAFAGISSAALKAVPLFFSLALIVVIYELGFELGNRWIARTAALLTAIAPATLVVWSAKARGGFIEIVFIGALALLLCCRALKQNPPSIRLTAAIGLLLGLGWWVNNQVIYFMLPIGFAYSAHLLRAPLRCSSSRPAMFMKQVVTGSIAFFLGGAPFWLYNLRNGFISFEIFGSSGSREILRHLAGVFTSALPILLGARRFWHTEDVFCLNCSGVSPARCGFFYNGAGRCFGSTTLVLCMYFVLFAILIWDRRRELAQIPLFKIAPERPIELHLLFLASALIVFAISSYGYLVEAPRYLLPAYVGITVLTAAALDVVRRRSSMAAYCLLTLVLSTNLMSSYLGGRALPGEPFVYKGERVSTDHSSLIRWLDDHGYRWVKTNYWIGYRLAFETKERIKFLLTQAPYQVRIADYEEEGLKLDLSEVPLVLVPNQAEILAKALALQGFSFKRETAGGYVIIYGLEPSQSDLQPVPDMLAAASHNPAAAAMAVDHNPSTRWGSAHPQTPGMQFVVELNPAQPLRGLEYDMGLWPQDYPRGLSIELELETGERRELLAAASYPAVLYSFSGSSSLSFFFEPANVRRVIFTNTGETKVFDWSIAEIRLFR